MPQRSPSRHGRSASLSILIVLVFALQTQIPSFARAAGATPDVAAANAVASPVSADASFTRYELDVSLETETRILSGTETIDWVNATGSPQDTIFLRLYPNADYYGDGRTIVSDVFVAGQPATATSGEDPTVLSIPLGESVAAGDRVTLSLDFESVVPLGSSGSFGIFGLDPERASWSLADWYPIVAGWEPSKDAWYLDEPTMFGDPTFSETSTYRLSLELPADLQLVSTGELTHEASPDADRVVRTVESGPVRDFALTLLPETSDSGGTLELTERKVSLGTDPDDATDIRLSMFAADSVPGLDAAILDAVATALPIYTEWMGSLPEEELDITTASLAGSNGVSWPGMVWLDLRTIVRDGELSDQERMGLIFVVTHEIGHQWIGGVIGNNSNDHGFMLEGLTNAMALVVLRESLGEDAAINYLGSYIAGPYSGLVRDGRDAIADAPITNDTNVVIRSLVVYGKAGLGFEAIRQELGNDAFRLAMGEYARTFRFGIASPEDLLAIYTANARDPDVVAGLWTFWFLEADTTMTDVDAIVMNSGS